MNDNFLVKKGFTLIELLVVIAIVSSLAALLLVSLASAKGRASRSVCLNNLRQIDLGIRMYSDDSRDVSPSPSSGAHITNAILYSYKTFVLNELGLTPASSQHSKLFSCPSDTFYYSPGDKPPYSGYTPQSEHDQAFSLFSSYTFNGNEFTNLVAPYHGPAVRGIAGMKLSSIKHPAKTIMISEGPAIIPYSWHQPKRPIANPQTCYFNNAMDMVGFVDGHVSYTKMYWDGDTNSLSMAYNPPEGYDYQWSGD
ncbi:type II secretion system protein [Pedosphaera parvula]|uniref:Type II secretory pathway pseudopilin PulG-like protein n=1 Tax=Pedosphaera parvula (strain Ellin514) TaxID=320771 RepID=B9XGW3_PEDPL|nr:type II secretion system protein [Pedosphaera parvula]EEF60884.1 Type II secretory pathway pseudopilin PulG-like protein [Pedosphaera parvula Ellin514]